MSVDRKLKILAVTGNGQLKLRDVLGLDIDFAFGANGVDAGIGPMLLKSLSNEPGLNRIGERSGLQVSFRRKFLAALLDDGGEAFQQLGECRRLILVLDAGTNQVRQLAALLFESFFHDDSRFALLRSAYAALHQLVFAAWYANPRAWAATGYGGPPSLEIG